MLCDKKVPVKTKGHVYKRSIRPALMYGAECWSTTKKHEQALHVAEMKMLRWSGGVTREDYIQNVYISGSFKTAPIQEKLLEGHLRWYGHVMRRPQQHMTRSILMSPTKPRGRGRPPMTWSAKINNDLSGSQLREEDTEDMALWKMAIRRPDPK